MPIQILTIEPIHLEWSEWYEFKYILLKRSLIPKSSGVYEVIEPDNECRLTIGESSNLNRRIRQNLIVANSHSAGKDIALSFEATIHSTLLVRWALTIRRAAAQEELHRLHILAHNCMPRFTDKT
jgi:hypothetical protein